MEQVNEALMEKYVSYVTDTIDKCHKVGDLVDDLLEVVTPARLNTALAMYFNVSVWLIAEYQRQKIVYEITKREFDAWKDNLFEQAKKQVMLEYSETKIKPSVTEFETRARHMQQDEYQTKLGELETAEARMRFLLRMSDLMKSYDSILTTLSSNMRQEMRTLSLDTRMNASPEGASVNKVRSNNFPTRVKMRESEETEDEY